MTPKHSHMPANHYRLYLFPRFSYLSYLIAFLAFVFLYAISLKNNWRKERGKKRIKLTKNYSLSSYD